MERKCLIGGIEVQLLPLPPLEWVRVNNKLPSFIYSLVQNNIAGTIKDTDLETFYNEVKSWLKVCVRIDGAPIAEAILEHLSLPEAASAATVVSSINGFDEQLRTFFLRVLQPRDAGIKQLPHQPSTTHDDGMREGNAVSVGN